MGHSLPEFSFVSHAALGCGVLISQLPSTFKHGVVKRSHIHLSGGVDVDSFSLALPTYEVSCVVGAVGEVDYSLSMGGAIFELTLVGGFIFVTNLVDISIHIGDPVQQSLISQVFKSAPCGLSQLQMFGGFCVSTFPKPSGGFPLDGTVVGWVRNIVWIAC